MAKVKIDAGRGDGPSMLDKLVSGWHLLPVVYRHWPVLVPALSGTVAVFLVLDWLTSWPWVLWWLPYNVDGPWWAVVLIVVAKALLVWFPATVANLTLPLWFPLLVIHRVWRRSLSYHRLIDSQQERSAEHVWRLIWPRLMAEAHAYMKQGTAWVPAELRAVTANPAAQPPGCILPEDHVRYLTVQQAINDVNPMNAEPMPGTTVQRLRSPANFLPTTSELLLRPNAAVEARLYEAQASAIKRASQHIHAIVSVDEGELLRVRLTQRRLPEEVPYTKVRALLHDENSTDPIELVGALGENYVVIGIDPSGQIVGIDLQYLSHLFVAGITNGGKGVLVRLIIAHAARFGHQVFIINPKRSPENRWAKGLTSMAYRPDAMVDMTYAVGELVELRADALNEAVAQADNAGGHLFDNLRDAPPDVQAEHPRVWFIIDEWLAYTGAASDIPNSKDDGYLRSAVEGVLTRIITQGRFVKVSVVGITQQPYVTALGKDMGGIIKAQFEGKAFLRHGNILGMKALFDEIPPASVTSAFGAPGRIVYTGFTDNGGLTLGGGFQAGQVIFAEQDDLRHLAAAYPGDEPRIFDDWAAAPARVEPVINHPVVAEAEADLRAEHGADADVLAAEIDEAEVLAAMAADLADPDVVPGPGASPAEWDTYLNTDREDL